MKKTLIISLTSLFLLTSCGTPNDGLGDLTSQVVTKESCEKVQIGTSYDRVVNYFGKENLIVDLVGLLEKGKGHIVASKQYDEYEANCNVNFEDNKVVRVNYHKYDNQ